ncbi:unnamed protein product [Rhizophagus irregularis]|uniref:DDE-1 domain-containing protein n=1 Tax=Rhizophagus irregularis TaxID=588596 RepID=A0A916EG57_9GLOM|nr:unnamed protein product [Rhizophagus irregularis]
MLTTLFQEWLQEFNYQVGIKHNKQRILLLLDNCKSYKIDTLVLENVEVYFLLPNTTLKLQPMDSGIIISFKKHYRYHHIKNCWNHIKILSNTDDERMIDDEDDELMLDDKLILDDELNKAIKTFRLPNMMEVKEFLTISEENIVYKIPDDISKFADMFKNGPTNHPDEIDDSAKIEIICVNKALQGLKIVNSFLLQQENASEQITQVKIEAIGCISGTRYM